MAGYINQTAQDALLDNIKTGATHMVYVDTLSTPPVYGDIAGTNIKATKVTPGFSGISGAAGAARSFTITQQTGLTIANSGNIRKWVLTNGSNKIHASGDVTGAPIAVVAGETWSTGTPAATVTCPAAV